MKLSHFVLGMGTFEIARRDLNIPLGKIYSFDEFKYREDIVKENYPDMDIQYLNPPTMYPQEGWKDMSFYNGKIEKSDIVCSLTPCGQLSNIMLTDDDNIKGESAEKNKWIYESVKAFLASGSEFLIMENSDHLSRNRGKSVIENIKGILSENKCTGYKIHLIRLNALSYGLPQHRERSILLIYKSDRFLNLPFSNIPYKNITDFIEEICPIENDPCNIVIQPYLDQAEWLLFIEQNKDKIFPYVKKTYQGYSGTKIVKFIEENHKELNYTNLSRVTKRIDKIINKQCIYDKSPIFIKDTIGCIIRKTIGRSLVPPYYNRFFTIRELMSLMGYPTSFVFNNPLKDYTYFYKAITVPVAKNIINNIASNKSYFDNNNKLDVLLQVNNFKNNTREFFNSELKTISMNSYFGFINI